MASNERKGLLGCMTAVMVLVVGVGVGAYIFINTFSDMSDSLTNFTVPGEYPLELTQGTSYIIYGASELGEPVPTANDVLLTLVHTGTGHEVDLGASNVDQRLQMGSRQWESIYRFEPPESGKYLLDADLAFMEQEHVVIALGTNVVFNLFNGIFVGIGVIGGTIVVSLLIGVMALIRRSKRFDQPPTPPATPAS
jgi:hypothetical protein